MREQIIYFDTLQNCWCLTPRENYEARIRSTRAVVYSYGDSFKTGEELRDYLVKHGYGTKEQYTIIPQEDGQ